MDLVCAVFCRPVRFVVNKVVCCNHFDVGIFDVDAARSTECNCNRAISCEQSPPYSLPKSLIGSTELRAFDTFQASATSQTIGSCCSSPPVHARALCNYDSHSGPVEHVLCDICNLVSSSADEAVNLQVYPMS